MILCCCRTYSTLIGQGKGSKTRLQQVVDWVGGKDFDGCLVFDEVGPCARPALDAVKALAGPYCYCLPQSSSSFSSLAHGWSDDLACHCSATRRRILFQARKLKAQRYSAGPLLLLLLQQGPRVHSLSVASAYQELTLCACWLLQLLTDKPDCP